MCSEIISSDPQNPYTSLLVSASAGSGKTYQLSRRFIHLVGAHADPAKILTITFTIKAAHEMRTRILNLASRLLTDKNEQNQYENKANLYYKLEKENIFFKTNSKIPKPLNAKKCALKIISASQKLKISTNSNKKL